MPSKKIILASGSPRRKEILEKIGLEFEVVQSNYVEDMTLPLPPRELAKRLALSKGEDVARRFPEALVIAADTVVLLDGKLLGKPHTVSAAEKMLTRLSGKTHEVITGLALICASEKYLVQESVSTSVVFKTLTAEVIKKYVGTGEPLDKAGAYAVQGLGGELIEKVEGDYWNVVGLPANLLAKHLRLLGIEARNL